MLYVNHKNTGNIPEIYSHPLVVFQNHIDYVYAAFLGIGVHHTGYKEERCFSHDVIEA